MIAAQWLDAAQPRVPVGRIVAALLLCGPQVLIAQTTEPPRLRAAALTESLTIDGLLNEPAWTAADRVDNFRQADPIEGAPATARTVVRVLASAKTIVVGIACDDPDPSRIVSFSVQRDAPLTSEDHVRVVFGPFLDGRSGYVFAVNPSGARYDGLINPGGESDNPDWDGIWEAATARTPPAGASRCPFPSRRSASNRACTNGISTCSGAFSVVSKLTAGRFRRASTRSRRRAAQDC